MIGTTNAMVYNAPSDIIRFIKSLQLKQNVIIKPNWVDANDGTHTDAKALDLIFSCFGGKKIIVESYTTWRNRLYLKGKDWPKQVINPEEGTIENISKHLDFLRTEDQWFLHHSGIYDVLRKHSVSYINISEEVLRGDTVPAKVASGFLDSGFKPIKNRELLTFIPKKLFDYRDYTFISLGKVKCDGNNVVTLSTKNLFGLIPAPSRWPKYHGYKDEYLYDNIIDINKIYRSIFDVTFINEGLFTAMEGPWPMELNPVYNWGRIIGGRNSIEVDSITAYMMGVENLHEIPLYKHAAELGKFEQKLINNISIELVKPLKFW